MTTADPDVLIVGAGPVGTALAIDLVRRGVTVRIIDKADHGFDGSRAKGIQPRNLDVLHDLGALDDVVARGSTYPLMGVHLGPFTVPSRNAAQPPRQGRRRPLPAYLAVPTVQHRPGIARPPPCSRR